MTVALAIRASDGIVLAADSQYTGGIKVEGQKIFGWHGHYAAVIVALAGHGPNGTALIQNCFERLGRIKKTRPDIVFLRNILRREIKSFQEEFIDRRPQEERQDAQVDLLFAIATSHEGTQLFYSEKSVLIRFEGYRAAGTGGWRVGEYILQKSYRELMTTDDATVLAMQVLAVGKHIDADSGGTSQFATIKSNGMYSHIVPFDVTRAERDILTYDRLCSELLLDIGDFTMEQEEFTRRCKTFESKIQAMREMWDEHGNPSRELIASLTRTTMQSISQRSKLSQIPYGEEYPEKDLNSSGD